MKRRVAVTGLGMVSAIGLTVSENWSSMTEAHSGISASGGRMTAEIPIFDSSNHFNKVQLSMFSRFTQLAVVAARQAVMDAGIEFDEELGGRTAVITGSSVAGQVPIEQLCADTAVGRKIHPLTIARAMSNAVPSAVTLEFKIHGPAYSVTSACASAAMAIGQAFGMVRNGDVDLAICGGSEAPFAEAHLHAWDSLAVMAPDTCRPFSRDRKGMVMGEGSAMLILEPLDEARTRGAKIYAELAGYGSSSDAYHVMRPSGDGAVMAMRASLNDANLDPEEIDYINAHGTGTILNDRVEASAIQETFKNHPPVSSTKSMHGHTLGAAGALEAVATVLSLYYGTLLPTANFLGPDPECDLDVITEVRHISIGAALSNSFAFGGLNAALTFRAKDAP